MQARTLGKIWAVGTVVSVVCAELLAWLLGLLFRFLAQLGCTVATPVNPLGSKAAAPVSNPCHERVYISWSDYLLHNSGVNLLVSQVFAFVIVVIAAVLIGTEISIRRKNNRFNTAYKLSFEDMTATRKIHLPKKKSR